MKLTQVVSLTLAVAPAFAIPPPDFGFPEAPNDTALEVAFQQESGSINFITVGEADLFGYGITAQPPVLGLNTTAYMSLSNYTGDYVVCMVDPDASYPEDPTKRFILHWLQPNMSQSTNVTVADLTLTGVQLVNDSAPAVPFQRPTPPTNSSAHRYIIYAFQQPANFAIPAAYSGFSAQNRTNFNLSNFIRDAELGTPAAANYFYVSHETSVPDNFTAAAGGSYPGGNGDAVSSGDPYRSLVPTSTPGASSAGGTASSSSSAAGAAMITGVGGIVGAGLVGLAALL